MSEVGKQIMEGLEEAVTLTQIKNIFKGVPLRRQRKTLDRITERKE